MGLVTTDNWNDFVNWAIRRTVVALDTETTGLRPYHGDRLVGISVGAEGVNWYLPFRHQEGPNLPRHYLDWIIDWLNYDIGHLTQWIGHNSKFDLHMLMKEGYHLPQHYPMERECCILDTLIGAHLVNENEKSFGLKPLCDKYGIGRGSADEQELKETITKEFRAELTQLRKQGAELRGSTEGMWKGLMWKLPPSLVAPYAMADVELTWELMTEYVWPGLQGWGLTPLFHQICNYNLLLTKMERRGIAVDLDALGRLTFEAEERAASLNGELWFATNGGIANCNSSAQSIRYFGIESTREMELNYAVMEGQVDPDTAKLLLDARGAYKVLNSYLLRYQGFAADDGAIHPSFKIHGTVTGRISCTDPNLMALPRDVTNQPAKSVFVPRSGMVLAEIDLSQAELRVASHFAAQLALYNADDENLEPTYLAKGIKPPISKMGEVLQFKTDLHTETMIKMQAYNPSITRDIAKRVNLSAIFGIGATKFSLTYAVPFNEAREALNDWRRIYPEFVLLYSTAEQMANYQKYITLPLSGRVRRYNAHEGSYSNKASSNWVQGTVADVIRIAMHNVDEYVTLEGGNLLLQVHDSLLLELPDDDRVPDILSMVQHLMTDFGFWPELRSEAKVGPSWGAMKPKETRHDALGAPV
jgi:DNA polymerase I-like protein with 3'-5' exonuclease and polymerase domains